MLICLSNLEIETQLKLKHFFNNFSQWHNFGLNWVLLVLYTWRYWKIISLSFNAKQKTFTNGHIFFFCFYEGLHFKCTLIAALWTILCDDFHVFLQTENLAFCTFPLHFYWHIYRGLNSIFSKWRKTEEGSRNCTSITVTCVISTSWGCCPNNDYHVTILTYVSCDDKQIKY